MAPATMLAMAMTTSIMGVDMVPALPRVIIRPAVATPPMST